MLKLSVSDAARYLLWGACQTSFRPGRSFSSSTSADSTVSRSYQTKECEDDELTIKAKAFGLDRHPCVQWRAVCKHIRQVSCPFLLLLADEDVVVNNVDYAAQHVHVPVHASPAKTSLAKPTGCATAAHGNSKKTAQFAYAHYLDILVSSRVSRIN
jgi:hypothetical protein